MGEGTKSVRYVSQSLSKSSRTRLLAFSTAFCGASSACACANMRLFFPLFDARSSHTSSSTSTRRCPWTAAYSSSSSASPAERRNGEPNTRLGARGVGHRATLGGRAGSRTRARVAHAGGDKAAPPPRYTFLVLRSSMSTWIIATIGACRSMRGGGEERASTWGCEADVDVERGFSRRVTGVGRSAINIFRCTFVLFEYLRKEWQSCKPVGMRRGVSIQRRASCFRRRLFLGRLRFRRRDVKFLAH